MKVMIVTTSKGTKSFQAPYAVCARENINLLARIQDTRPLSQVAADFEGITKLIVDGDDFSLYNTLMKVSRATPEEVSLTLRRTL